MMKYLVSVWLLGLGLGVWIGQHGEGRLQGVSVLEWLVLVALVVGSILILVVPWASLQEADRQREQAGRREEVE